MTRQSLQPALAASRASAREALAAKLDRSERLQLAVDSLAVDLSLLMAEETARLLRLEQRRLYASTLAGRVARGSARRQRLLAEAQAAIDELHDRARVEAAYGLSGVRYSHRGGFTPTTLSAEGGR
jgi:hypothetical protein